MANVLNTDVKPVVPQDTSECPSINMKIKFEKWLTDGNARKFSTGVILSCMDDVSDYAVRKKIAVGSIWEYLQPSVFSVLYKKMLEAKLFRITNHKAHKVFIIAGQLYLKFLKEKPFITIEPAVSSSDKETTLLDAEQMQAKNLEINPDDVVAWLVTQPNANGTLYLKHVVRSYMCAIRNLPKRLFLNPSQNRNVFLCRTVAEFDELSVTFKSATNYVDINKASSGHLSAGLAVYRRYLDYIERGKITSIEPERKKAKRTVSANESRVTFTSKQYEATAEMTQQNTQTETTLSNDEMAAIKLVLSERYTNGFRLDLIELSRMKRFVKEYCDVELVTNDNELMEAIKTCGVLFDNRIYVISNDTKTKIVELVENYVAQGATVIFFEEFYVKNESWLLEASIVSEDLLKHTVKQLFPNFSFTTTYFGQTKTNLNSVLISEILRIWGSETLLSYEQICERLQYIPLERIKFALGQNAEFIWNSIGYFTHISKVDVDEDEREIIQKEVQKECLAHSYVSIADLPIDDFIHRNHELSITAVQNAVFFSYLSGSYEKRGKIITFKGERLDLLEIMREYCRSHDRLTLKELLSFEQDLTGECHRWIPMQAGYDVMVRINKDTYLSEEYVHFDAQAIDEVLEHFIHGEYTPIRTVTIFTLFPHCGQAWNLFLLESYLRRFSHLFRFETTSVNNKNAGCIVRKNSKLDYNGIMVDAVAKANISLDETTVANFLFDNGYRGSRNKTKLMDLIKLAEKVRNTL